MTPDRGPTCVLDLCNDVMRPKNIIIISYVPSYLSFSHDPLMFMYLDQHQLLSNYNRYDRS